MLCLAALPRASPWAITYGPFRAGHEHLVIVGLAVITQSNTPEPGIISGDGHANLIPLGEAGEGHFRYSSTIWMMARATRSQAEGCAIPPLSETETRCSLGASRE